MVELIKLEIEGFGKFDKKKTINFKKGVNFINGLNEAGKSTILEAILASLFKYTNTKIEPFFCWTNKDVCRLTLTYKTDKGETFQIISDYKNAIILWNQEDVTSEVTTKEYSFNMQDESIKHGLNVFNFELQKQDSSIKNYFIIQNIENLTIQEPSFSDELEGYSYVTLTSSMNSITFSTIESIASYEIPAFIAPEISELFSGGSGFSYCGDGYCDSDEDEISCPDDCEDNLGKNGKEWFKNNWKYIVIGLAGMILIIGVIIFIIFGRNYNEKKEMKLFKTKTNLFNVLHYINSSKRRGMSDYDIKENLRKVGWTSAQIEYAMKKYKKSIKDDVRRQQVQSR